VIEIPDAPDRPICAGCNELLTWLFSARTKRWVAFITLVGHRLEPHTCDDRRPSLWRPDPAAYLTRTGNADLLPVLGGEVDGDLAVDCPTCSARAGSGCRQDGKAMKRPHVARRLAVDAAEHERQARAELDEETAGE
jgi:hypothetical protein